MTTTCRSRNKRKKYVKRDASVGFFGIAVVGLMVITITAETIASSYIKNAYGATQKNGDPAAGQSETVAVEEITLEAGANLSGGITEEERTIETTPTDPVFVPLPVDMPIEDQEIVFEIATENEIGFAFVMAIIGHETEFTKEARSTTGDSGYMQINDCNLEAMEERGFVDMYDTADNVGAGCSMLRDLFDTYGDGEPDKVLMAYNMGSYGASKLWAQGITSSEYSRDILRREKEYSAHIDAQRAAE